MSKRMTEQVASYIYDKHGSCGIYNVFACYNSVEDYDNRKVDFYDVYDNSGLCVNEGEPFYEFPSWQDIYNYYYLPSLDHARRCPSKIPWAIQ
jgi:hypothetical protein